MTRRGPADAGRALGAGWPARSVPAVSFDDFPDRAPFFALPVP